MPTEACGYVNIETMLSQKDAKAWLKCMKRTNFEEISEFVVLAYLSVVIRVFEDSPDNLQHWCYTRTTSDLEPKACTLFNSYSMLTGLPCNQTYELKRIETNTYILVGMNSKGQELGKS